MSPSLRKWVEMVTETTDEIMNRCTNILPMDQLLGSGNARRIMEMGQELMVLFYSALTVNQLFKRS